MPRSPPERRVRLLLRPDSLLQMPPVAEVDDEHGVEDEVEEEEDSFMSSTSCGTRYEVGVSAAGDDHNLCQSHPEYYDEENLEEDEEQDEEEEDEEDSEGNQSQNPDSGCYPTGGVYFEHGFKFISHSVSNDDDEVNVNAFKPLQFGNWGCSFCFMKICG